MKKVVIIGGNAAGLSAASQVKRQNPGWEVTVYEKGRYISYGACGIPYYVAGLVPSLDKLITLTAEEATTKRNLILKLLHEVRAINPTEKKITFSAKGHVGSDSFDYLVIATGADPQKGVIEYSPSTRVLTVNNLDDADALRGLIEEGRVKRCAVIGGGYIAIEILEALKQRGLETDLVHRRQDLARSFEKEISELALAAMENKGINLRLNRPVSRILEQNERVEVCSGEEALDYDLVVVATGVEPNSALARDCAIETGVKGAIKVNQYMQTSCANIYAAGDCTETTNIITGRPVYVPLALKANKEGVVAGINICGGGEAFPGIAGTAVTKFFDLGLARTGLTLSEALEHGFEATKFTVKSNSRSHYYPGGGTVTTVLIADKKEGRLLGAQLAGPLDSVKRIDVYASALTAKMNMNQLFHLDLAYAPPFAPVYDPVILAGRVGRKMVAE